jgi:hypothetical protein
VRIVRTCSPAYQDAMQLLSRKSCLRAQEREEIVTFSSAVLVLRLRRQREVGPGKKGKPTLAAKVEREWRNHFSFDAQTYLFLYAFLARAQEGKKVDLIRFINCKAASE